MVRDGAAPRVGPPRRASRPGAPFRPDIEGLRAVAVVAVVLFHAGVGVVPGGYVGVDVFYVISGFLITDHLWRETARSGRLAFARFYARRARRLLPAAILVLVVTMAVAAAVLPPLEVRSVWKDGLYCALYAGNFRFAADRTNYLADRIPSPFQHYWSLGVEEQFYLLWPLLVVVASMAWWRRPSRATAIGAVAAVSAGSLVLSVTLTRSDQPAAFFLLPARAWELGLGGLVALAAPELRRLPPAAARAAGWAGLAAIAVSCAALGSRTPYPGTAAVLPVAGAGAVLIAGLSAPSAGAGRWLGRTGMRAMGRISYSWYLWHYPVLILAPAAVGHALSEPANVALAAGTGALAVLTFRFVEQPTRQAGWWSARPGRSLKSALALSSAGVVACLGAAVSIPSLHGHGMAPVAVIRNPPTTVRPAAGASAPPPPASTALAAAQAQVVAAVQASAGTRDVPANLTPSLSAASASEAAPMVDGCLTSYTATAVPDCLFGATTSTRSIVLFGDSHAAMWFPSIDAFANHAGYRLYVWTKAACPPVRIVLFSPVLQRTWTECATWYGNAMARIAALRPSLVVVGIAPNYDAAYDVVQNGPAWQSGLAATVSATRQAGSRVLVLGSVPGPVFNVPDCLSANLTDVPACDFSPIGRRVSGGGLVGIDLPGDAAAAAAVRSAGGAYADVRPWFCTASLCDTVVDNLLVYRDNSHITVPYADYLAPLVGDEMAAALAS